MTGGDTAYAGDDYAMSMVWVDRVYDAQDVWSAMARFTRADPMPAATFTVVARAGTVADVVTGDDETGNTVVVITLAGTDVDDLVGVTVCDVQVIPDGATRPVTILTWQLTTTQDVTR